MTRGRRRRPLRPPRLRREVRHRCTPARARVLMRRGRRVTPSRRPPQTRNLSCATDRRILNLSAWRPSRWNAYAPLFVSVATSISSPRYAISRPARSAEIPSWVGALRLSAGGERSNCATWRPRVSINTMAAWHQGTQPICATTSPRASYSAKRPVERWTHRSWSRPRYVSEPRRRSAADVAHAAPPAQRRAHRGGCAASHCSCAHRRRA